MTAQAMAALYAAAFPDTRAWSADEIAALLAQTNVISVVRPHGFALAQLAADQADILTICVAPKWQRMGRGRAILEALERDALAQGAEIMTLDVRADNGAACALYTAAGYQEAGRRKDYYQAACDLRIDALILTKPLVQGA